MIPGRLVRLDDGDGALFYGVVLSLKEMENTFRDTSMSDPIVCARVLWSEPLPAWYPGWGNVREVIIDLLEVVG